MKKLLKQNTTIWRLLNQFYWLHNRLTVLGQGSRSKGEPTLAKPQSQLATARQFIEKSYIDWCSRLHCHARVHRKKWEYAYILQSLDSHGLIAPGSKGLVFGCGQESIPALLAQMGCTILATDLDQQAAEQKGWVDSKEHAASAEILNHAGICPPKTFAESVSYRTVNMNDIPDDLNGFDFLWSSCAFEHLGSLDHGLNFVIDAMKCLKPGGLAVHTTEFNYSSDTATFESQELSLYRRQDMLRLKQTLESDGHTVAPFNWNTGDTKLDLHVDLPPFAEDTCLRLRLKEFDCTSIGIAIRKAG